MKIKRKAKSGRITVLLLFLFFMLLLSRLIFINILSGTFLARYRDPDIDSEYYRGTIYDAKGNILALDVPYFEIVVDTRRISGPAHVSSILYPYTNYNAVELENLLSSNEGPVQIASILTNSDLEEFFNLLGTEGLSSAVTVQKNIARVYPTDNYGSQIIGRTKDGIGVSGAEKIFEDRLRYPLAFDSDIVKGEDIYLALDLEIQYALDTVIASYTSREEEITLAVIDTDSSSLLALFSEEEIPYKEFFSTVVPFEIQLENEEKKSPANTGDAVLLYDDLVVYRKTIDSYMFISASRNPFNAEESLRRLIALLETRGRIIPGTRNDSYQAPGL